MGFRSLNLLLSNVSCDKRAGPRVWVWVRSRIFQAKASVTSIDPALLPTRKRRSTNEQQYRQVWHRWWLHPPQCRQRCSGSGHVLTKRAMS